jgi:DNA-binding transcriptional LysR family regulator
MDLDLVDLNAFLVEVDAAADLLVAAAIGGCGIINLFEDWLRPHFVTGALEPVLESWWQRFSGQFLHYPGRRLLPAPLRAFVDFIKSESNREAIQRQRPAS